MMCILHCRQLVTAEHMVSDVFDTKYGISPAPFSHPTNHSTGLLPCKHKHEETPPVFPRITHMLFQSMLCQTRGFPLLFKPPDGKPVLDISRGQLTSPDSRQMIRIQDTNRECCTSRRVFRRKSRQDLNAGPHY